MNRTKILLTCLLSLFFIGSQLKSQNYTDTINYVFEHVDKDRINTGLLSDYGIQIVDITAFDGIPADSNYVNMDTWKQLYAGLYTSKINSNVSLSLPDDVNDIIDGANDSPVPLTMMHYEYNKLNDDAVALGLLQITNNQIFDVPNTASPYLTKNLFAVAPKSLDFNSLTASFVFNSDLWFSNTTKTIQKLEVNFNNESGYLNATWDNAVSYTFSFAGQKTIYFKLTYTDGSNYTSQTIISMKNSMQQVPGFTPRTIVIAPNSEHSGGRLEIRYANAENTTRNLRKTLIVAEGYDVSCLFPDYNSNILSFIKLYSNFYDYPRFGTINVPFTTTSTLLNELDTNNFDIVYLDYNNGIDDIKRNARLLEAAIDWVNQHKENNEINMVMGISMGGLVARYALRDMELNNRDHNAIKFISVDSPHKGANVPVGAQAAVRHLETFTPLINTIEWFTKGATLSGVNRVFELLNSTGTKQLLTYYVSPNFTYNNEVHDTFMTEIENMGFPRKCQIIALTDGAGDGTKNFTPESNIINFNQSVTFVSVNAFASAIKTLFASLSILPSINLNIVKNKTEFGASLVVNALPDKSIKNVYSAKIYIKKKILWIIPIEIDLMNKALNSTVDMVALDGAPGGTYDVTAFGFQIPSQFLSYVNQTKFCFIPTTSALCLSNWKDVLNNTDLHTTNLYANGTCPFEYYFTPTANEYHTRFNPSASFLYDHLITNYLSNVYTQNETLNTSRYIAGNDIFVGNNVTSSKTPGNVTITNGVNVVFEGNSVTFDAGFECANGSTFEIKLK